MNQVKRLSCQGCDVRTARGFTGELVIKVLAGEVVINDADESGQAFALVPVEDDEEESSDEIHGLAVAVHRIHVHAVRDQDATQLLDLCVCVRVLVCLCA